MSYLAFLKTTRAGFEAHGETERAAAIQAEIDELTGASAQRAEVAERSAPPRQRRAPRKAQG